MYLFHAQNHRPSCVPCFSCLECSCDVRGSTNLTCHLTTGVCSCKEFVEGDKCDRCREGYRFLEASNPSGCSAGEMHIQSDLTHPHTSVLNEIVDKVRELDK